MPNAICNCTCVRSVLHIHLSFLWQASSKIICPAANMFLPNLAHNIQRVHLQRFALVSPRLNMQSSCCFFWCIFATDMNVSIQCVQMPQPQKRNENVYWGTKPALFFPKQLSSWMGFSILARNGLCPIMISWFVLVPALVPALLSLLVSSLFAQKISLFHHDFLVPPGSGSGSGACLPSCLASCLSSCLFSFCPKKGVCSIMISWFLLVPVFVSLFVSLLSLLRKRILFHHDFLVPPASGSGSGPCLPSCLASCLSSCLFSLLKKGVCSIMISWFLLVPALVSPLVSRLVFFLSLVLAAVRQDQLTYAAQRPQRPLNSPLSQSRPLLGNMDSCCLKSMLV